MKSKTAAKMPDAYFKLVKAFPLVRIRDERHLAEARKVLNELTAQDLDAGGEAYVDVLCDLVEAFEDGYEPAEEPLGDVLKDLLAANRLSQQELAKAVGIPQPTISALIKGSRQPTLDHVRKLAKHFNMAATTFLTP